LRDIGPLTTNTVWGLNVHRVWRALKQQTDSWVWGERWMQKPANAKDKTTQDVLAPAGEMTLGSEGAVAVSDVAFGSPDQGEVRFHATLTNTTPAEAWLWAKLLSGSGEVRRDFTNEPYGRVKLAPGQAIRLEHQQALRNPSTADLAFELLVANVSSNAVYRANSSSSASNAWK